MIVPGERGRLKQALLKIGWPADDLAGYVDGSPHSDRPNEHDPEIRPRSRCAPTSRRRSTGFAAAGSGVVVLPCGAGKTLVGAAAMAGDRRAR